MQATNLDTFASVLALCVRKKLANVHRGTMMVGNSDQAVLAAVFGNDEYEENETARHEVEIIRDRLQAAGFAELGFGVSPDGQAWSLLVKAQCQPYETIAGKAFHLELLRAAVDDAIWGECPVTVLREDVEDDETETVVLPARNSA